MRSATLKHFKNEVGNTGHFTLYYIEKLVSTGSHFLATFCCLISCIG